MTCTEQLDNLIEATRVVDRASVLICLHRNTGTPITDIAAMMEAKGCACTTADVRWAIRMTK